MSMWMTVVLAVQILAALTMAGLILVQHGKGADMGASLGAGSSGSLFGASGSANFLSRMTALSATVFFAATLVLAFMASSGMQRTNTGGGSSVLDNVTLPAPVETGPAAGIPGAGGVATPDANAPVSTGNAVVDSIPGAAPQTPAAGEAGNAPEAAPAAPAAGQESAPADNGQSAPASGEANAQANGGAAEESSSK